MTNATDRAVTVNQTLQLTFLLAWGEDGTSWERFLATIISAAPALRILSNSIIFLGLVQHRALRQTKEHLLMMYTGVYDFFDACWVFSSVFFYYQIQTRISCFFTFRHLCYLYGQSSVTMLLMISVDRLLSVSAPVWYWKQSYRLGHILGGIAAGWAVCFSPFLVVSGVQNPHELIPHCFTTYVFKAYKGLQVDFALRRVILGASVVLYVAVLAVYSTKRLASLKKVTSSQNQDLRESAQFKQFKQHQKKMTVTLGLSALATLLGYIIPLSAFDAIRIRYPSLQQYGWLMWVPINLSSVANIFIFSRQREVRQALFALFTWSRLPKRLQDWDGKFSQQGVLVTSKQAQVVVTVGQT